MTVGDDQQWMLVFPKITSRNRSDSVLRPFFFGGGDDEEKKSSAFGVVGHYGR